MAEVLRRFEVQVHQLTPNVVVALAKYVWATTSYGGQPSVEVFAKHYCLHWQKRKIGHEIAQFGSCTFTLKSGKTSMEVVELVPCARNKWGNWWDFWFYVSEGEVEDHPGLPVAVMCSHYYVAYPQFEVAEDDEDEGALRRAARMSSGRDLVEEFVGYGVWPLAHGWALGEVCPRQMPFFAAGLRLPAHRFMAEVLRRFEVQVHQLTPNVVVALAKYVWATTSYGGQPSVEVFAKHYCLHWQKRKIGHEIAQFGSCTFTLKSGKTSMEVVELVPCARNKWGNWWDFWFYVSEGEVEDHPGLPVAVMCSHYYVAYPQFEVAEDDEDEGALRRAARMSSGRDLVEEFVGYGVWPLAHGWALGEVCPRQMPFHGGRVVRSPAFALNLQSRDPAAFVRTVCIGKKGKLEIRLHSLDRARLCRGPERLRSRLWS